MRPAEGKKGGYVCFAYEAGESIDRFRGGIAERREANGDVESGGRICWCGVLHFSDDVYRETSGAQELRVVLARRV